MNLQDLQIDSRWTLFLDRDGVINRGIEHGYVKNLSEFQLIDGALEALRKLSKIFPRIIIVTNQQGVGKGVMTENDLIAIHKEMLKKITDAGGRIDKIYYCTAADEENSPYRKPNTGMAIQAKSDFPEIDYEKSIMVGDSLSDMEFGKRLNMKTIQLLPDNRQAGSEGDPNENDKKFIDFKFKDLLEFANAIVIGH